MRTGPHGCEEDRKDPRKWRVESPRPQEGSTRAKKRARIGNDDARSLSDDYFRFAYSEIRLNEKRTTCATFPLPAATHFADHGINRIERVMRDNSWSFRRGTPRPRGSLPRHQVPIVHRVVLRRRRRTSVPRGGSHRREEHQDDNA
jgi:hypothetical protein